MNFCSLYREFWRLWYPLRATKRVSVLAPRVHIYVTLVVFRILRVFSACQGARPLASSARMVESSKSGVWIPDENHGGQSANELAVPSVPPASLAISRPTVFRLSCPFAYFYGIVCIPGGFKGAPRVQRGLEIFHNFYFFFFVQWKVRET